MAASKKTGEHTHFAAFSVTDLPGEDDAVSHRLFVVREDQAADFYQVVREKHHSDGPLDVVIAPGGDVDQLAAKALEDDGWKVVGEGPGNHHGAGYLIRRA